MDMPYGPGGSAVTEEANPIVLGPDKGYGVGRGKASYLILCPCGKTLPLYCGAGRATCKMCRREYTYEADGIMYNGAALDG